MQTQQPDDLLIYMKALSILSEEKKTSVRKLGFGALLNLSCASNINQIFEWLLMHFSTSSSSVMLENGFSFSLTPMIVHKLFGLPVGPTNVKMNSTKEATHFIHNLVGMEKATVQYLCSILSNNLDEHDFSIIFMMASLSAFVAPNGRGYASTKYYPSLLNVPGIPSLDWSSFGLNWLLFCILRHRRRIVQNEDNILVDEPGGCKMILVV